MGVVRHQQHRPPALRSATARREISALTSGANAGSRTRINGFGGHYTIHCATFAGAVGENEAQARRNRQACARASRVSFQAFHASKTIGSTERMMIATITSLKFFCTKG